MAKTRKFLKFPVTANGIYKSLDGKTLEYWFFFKGRTAKIGEAKADLPPALIDEWERQVKVEMQKLLAKHFGPAMLGSQ